MGQSHVSIWTYHCNKRGVSGVWLYQQQVGGCRKLDGCSADHGTLFRQTLEVDRIGGWRWFLRSDGEHWGKGGSSTHHVCWCGPRTSNPEWSPSWPSGLDIFVLWHVDLHWPPWSLRLWSGVVYGWCWQNVVREQHIDEEDGWSAVGGDRWRNRNGKHAQSASPGWYVFLCWFAGEYACSVHITGWWWELRSNLLRSGIDRSCMCCVHYPRLQHKLHLLLECSSSNKENPHEREEEQRLGKNMGSHTVSIRRSFGLFGHDRFGLGPVHRLDMGDQ